MIHPTLGKLHRWCRNRFATLRWPLASLPERVEATSTHQIMNSRASRTRFPIRGLRYWWIRCALVEEAERREEEIVVADVGCSTGHSKLFVGDLPGARWIGLDRNINEDILRECGYSELYQCDFDKPLLLPDRSVDVIIFSHVVEHLLRPDFTVGELSRILKPDRDASLPAAPWPPMALFQIAGMATATAVADETNTVGRTHQLHVSRPLEAASPCARCEL